MSNAVGSIHYKQDIHTYPTLHTDPIKGKEMARDKQIESLDGRAGISKGQALAASILIYR